MSLIKFITVFDDEKQKLLYYDILKTYSISAYPSAYYNGKRAYIDVLGTNSAKYFEHLNEFENLTGPTIPVAIFQDAISKAYDDGYLVAAIICPFKKWMPQYYRNAVLAAENFRRHIDVDHTTFKICVIDSKAFAAGYLYFTLQLARLHVNDHCPTGIVLEDSKNFVSKTIYLTKSGEKFGFENGKFAAFRTFGKRFYTDINISESTDYVKFDNFAKACAKYIRISGGKYCVSFGAGCNFSGNVIGRIEKILGYPPIATMQYSTTSAAVLGLETICIHIFSK